MASASNLLKSPTTFFIFFTCSFSSLFQHEYIVKIFSIAIYKDKVVLNNNSLTDNIYNLDYLPYVINDIDSIYDSFVKNFNKIDNSILYRISQIEYKPNDIDEERFLLYMIDGNYVYISLSKIEKINKYNSIVASMKDQKGIIYLDSGDYVEIKK